jgi:hypothetical protein
MDYQVKSKVVRCQSEFLKIHSCILMYPYTIISYLTEATVRVRSGGAPSPADKTLTPISSYVDTFLRLHNAERLPLSSEGRLGSEGSPEPTSHLFTYLSCFRPVPQRH